MAKLILCLSFLSLSLGAMEDPSCKNLRMADTGWTDVSLTTAIANELLKALNYTPQIFVLSVPVTFSSLQNKDIDVFLGNWMPTQKADISPYLANGSVIQVKKNLSNARYTLAVPRYVYEEGVQSLNDLAKNAHKFAKNIYGIEPGNDGNRLILQMIADKAFLLTDWQLIESSEQGMLVAVHNAIKEKKWVVFLAWEPHPMNLNIDLNYLAGGDDYFGPHFGKSAVYTVLRKDFLELCPNLTNFFKNLVFSVDLENKLMQEMIEKDWSPTKAAKQWLQQHQDFAFNTVNLLKSFDGQDAKTTLNNYFKQNQQDLLKAKPTELSIGALIKLSVDYLVNVLSPYFRSFSLNFEKLILRLTDFLLNIPSLLLVLIFSLLIFCLSHSFWSCLGSLSAWFFISNLGFVDESIQTLVLVLFATLICTFVGVPLGIMAAKMRWWQRIIMPLLDLSQTMPTFVYLIPTLMLFGLGVVPGLISTVIFAISPPIRLSCLGIQSVPKELVEAARAFGASPLQLLFKVELPAALPSILEGLSNSIMLSLSMVVVAALVGAPGLGTPVVRALNTVDIQMGFEAGLSIVVLAIVLDRTLKLLIKKKSFTYVEASR